MNATDAAAQIVALSGGPGIRVTVFDHPVSSSRATKRSIRVLDNRGSHIHCCRPGALGRRHGAAPDPQALPSPSRSQAIPNRLRRVRFFAWLLLVSLTPYFVIVLLIGAAAVAISWFVGRPSSFGAAAIDEVTDRCARSRRDYTRRRFVWPAGTRSRPSPPP